MSKASREEINRLHNENIELRKILNSGIEMTVNKRDEMINKVEENEFLINELESELSNPVIVPVTGTKPISEHKYNVRSTFSKNSVRL